MWLRRGDDGGGVAGLRGTPAGGEGKWRVRSGGDGGIWQRREWLVRSYGDSSGGSQMAAGGGMATRGACWYGESGRCRSGGSIFVYWPEIFRWPNDRCGAALKLSLAAATQFNHSTGIRLEYLQIHADATYDQIHQTQHVLITGTSQSRQHDKSEPDMLEQALDRKSTTGGCQFLDVDQYHAVQETNSGLLGFRRPLQNLPAAGITVAKTINGEAQLHALVDGKKIIITESSIRRDLQLADEEGVDCLPNSTIFEQLM
ncbi:hypothetical protein Tco_0290306 [Tanacetum coccineum]